MSATTSDQTVWTLLVCLLILQLLLVILYKKLNKDTGGQYTIRRMVYKDGGARDRVRGAVAALETRLGIRLWPRSEEEEEEEGEEMRDLRDEERDVERGHEKSVSEGEEERDEGEGGGDSSSDDYSSLDGYDMKERAMLAARGETDGETTEGETEERGEEEGESGGDGGSEEGAEGGECGCGEGGAAGLLIDLKQISGSVTWSEEKKDEEGKECDVTAF